MKEKIINLIGEAALYEQLAEECVELAKESLKMARIIRNENPTPSTKEEVSLKITEEFTDVIQCSNELNLSIDQKQMIKKDDRWRKRIMHKK